MTEVFVKKVRDRVISVNTKGHAGFAKRGKDIVCSAVSVLLINTVNSIKCFTEDEIEAICRNYGNCDDCPLYNYCDEEMM